MRYRRIVAEWRGVRGYLTLPGPPSRARRQATRAGTGVSGATLERRLANYRAAIRSGAPAAPADPGQRSDASVARGSIELGQRLAEALDGELILDPAGPVVRVEPATMILPLDRERLHYLPGQPPPDAPLVCLDTETTGLATAAGTVAFLVGLGWWEGDRFRQAQLLLPDHPAEAGLLARVAAHIPADAWLVTYNGKGFDWPLLVARYRMARLPAPVHAGHLDLLPFVRRVYRHRMPDARLRTVETELLGTVRHGDVDGWQIPGLYLDFLRGGEAWPLIDVVRHNREDVRSLALGFFVGTGSGEEDPARDHRLPRLAPGTPP